MEEEPFPWEIFQAVLLPPKDEFRKPNRYLFDEAAQRSAPGSYVYEGEDAAEISAALSYGVHAYQIWVGGKASFLPESEMDRFAHP